MTIVTAGITRPTYNNNLPFHPDTAYPELSFADLSTQPNFPYLLLRNLLYQHGYDKDHYGTAKWNPLRTIIQPGQTVVLKPNFVLSINNSGDDIFAVVTHPSILRALIDYVFIALKGDGRIIIADAPQMDCDWDELMAVQRIDAIQSYYHSKFRYEIELYDLRNFALIDSRISAFSHNRKKLAGDPLGSVVINLGRDSLFYGLPAEGYYGADFDRTETIKHHHGETHEYCVSKTILSADVLISVPKMKVHKKVGVTLNLKGLVGINTNKNYLIHYRLGTPSDGGDQLPDGLDEFDRLITKGQRWFFDKAMARQNRWGDLAYKSSRNLYRWLVKPIRSISDDTLISDAGNWHGNDSAWRMTADLAKIIIFADVNGKILDTPCRKILCVVDGIIGGENNGPLMPDAKRCGCLVIGENPLAVDMVTSQLMGFNIEKIKQFSIADKYNPDFPAAKQIDVLVNETMYSGELFFNPNSVKPLFRFKPHPGWVGHIETEMAEVMK